MDGNTSSVTAFGRATLPYPFCLAALDISPLTGGIVLKGRAGEARP